MQAKKKELVPKGLLYGIIGMVLLSLVFVFSTSDTSRAKLVEPVSSKVLGSRVMNLTKLDDGSVALSNLENEENDQSPHPYLKLKRDTLDKTYSNKTHNCL